MYKKIKCKGQLHFYVEYGQENKKVIVFLHGYSDSARTFEPLEDYLSNKYRVIIPDLPMIRKKGVSYDLQGLSSFVDDIVKEIGLSSFILCGFSFGGLVAADFAYRFPKKIKKLYMLNSVPQFLAPEIVDRLFLKIDPQKIPHLIYSILAFLKTSKIGKAIVPQTERLEESLKNIDKRPFAVLGTMYEVFRQNIIGGSWKERVIKFLEMPMPKVVVLFKDDNILSYKKYVTKLRRSGVEVISFDRGGHGETKEYWENLKKLF